MNDLKLPVQLVPYRRPKPLVPAPATATVVGAGRSGLAAAKLLLDKGYKVRLTDSGSSPELERGCAPLADRGAAVSLGEQEAAFAAGSDFIVVSPGIDERAGMLADPALEGIPVFGEVEIAYWYSPVPILAVTGTNGKSTTVSLLAAVLSEAGIGCVAAGNIGLALCRAVTELTDEAAIVAEISSFQLHTTESFHPLLAVLLNLAPDHLERYDTLERYYRTKFRLFRRMEPGDLALLNADDPRVVDRRALAGDVSMAWFSRSRPAGCLAWVENRTVCLRRRDGGTAVVVPLEDIRLRGAHNLENILAATAAASACGVDPQSIGRTVREFRGLPHRLETVAEIEGVHYVNDSKATTVESVRRALDSFPGPVVLIMGGRHKGAPYGELVAPLHEKVRAVLALGEAAGLIQRELGGSTEVIVVDGLEQAVDRAGEIAREGDIVLLSPGCSSYDMFDNYEQRGDRFKQIVRALGKGD